MEAGDKPNGRKSGRRRQAVHKGFSLLIGIPMTIGALVTLTGCPGAGDAAPVGKTIVAGIPAKTTGDQNTCSVPANNDVVISEVLRLINEERASWGLQPVQLDPVLTQIAEDYCCEMIEQGFFAHENPVTGERHGDRAYKAGYTFLAMGENLAAGQETAEQVVAEWMASPDHKDIILGIQWRSIGIGVRTGGEFGVYWVLDFSNPP